MDKALKDMPEDYEIKDFLLANQAEVKSMCLTEYNEAETMQMFKKEREIELIEKMLLKGKSAEEIAELCDLSVDYVKGIENNM